MRNFEIKVAHRAYEIGSINDRVIQNICNSDLVIANLTGLNPMLCLKLLSDIAFWKTSDRNS